MIDLCRLGHPFGTLLLKSRKFLPPNRLQLRHLQRLVFSAWSTWTSRQPPPGESLGVPGPCLQRHRGYPSLSQKGPQTPSSPHPRPQLFSCLPITVDRHPATPSTAALPAATQYLPRSPALLPPVATHAGAHLGLHASSPFCVPGGYLASVATPGLGTATPYNRFRLPQDGLFLPARCPE